ncbi:MAG: OmpA family protein [Tannerellaceae bacterium]
MRAKTLMFSLLAAATLSATAQEYQPMVGYSTESGAKTNFKKNAAKDNWFISVAGGASILFNEGSQRADFGERLNFMPSVSFGKWFNPYTGFRAQINGGSLHGYMLANSATGALRQMNNKFVGGHVDLMWDVTNYFGNYNENRLFRFIPWVGVGYMHRFENQGYKASNVPTMNAGILTAFRVSKRIDINVEAQAAAFPSYFDEIPGGTKNFSGMASLSAGLTFKLGKTDFEVIEPMDYALLNDLNGQINRLRSENEELSKRPVSCPECEEAIVNEEVIIASNVVYFRLNSAKIDKNQQINVFNTADFIKNNNATVKVVGYASKESGTAEYNMQLSEKRAKAVAKELMEKYGIPSSQIVVEWKGAEVQPYANENAWNRVVIMQAE